MTSARLRGGLGGSTTLQRHGRTHFQAMAALSRSCFAYGDSDAAKRQRMSDIGQKRVFLEQHGPVLGLRLWEAMVERHRRQFGQPVQRNQSEEER